MHTRTLAALLVSTILVLTGCGATTTAAGGADTAAGSSGAAATRLAFTGTELDGSTLEGADLAGKPTVFWFWAPWCPTCRAQAPGVSALATEYDGRVNVVGVGGLADEADIRDFAQQVEGPIHLVDPDGAIWRHFGVTAQSTYLVLDAAGDVVVNGYLDDPVLADKVAGLVG